MRFIFVGLYLAMCSSVYAETVASSPAGGGYFQIYGPGDYAFVRDHDDFDVNFHASTSFTIEFWFYQKRPMKPLDRMRIIPNERWYLINKAGSYNIKLSPNNIAFDLEGSVVRDVHTGVDIPLNQWHYVAFMVDRYRQKVINTHLWGSALIGRTKFIGCF